VPEYELTHWRCCIVCKAVKSRQYHLPATVTWFMGTPSVIHASHKAFGASLIHHVGEVHTKKNCCSMHACNCC